MGCCSRLVEVAEVRGGSLTKLDGWNLRGLRATLAIRHDCSIWSKDQAFSELGH